VAFHAPARDAVFVGDAFVTRNVITGRRGPHFATTFNEDHRRAVASLARLEGLAARHVLPGHGDAWAGGLGEALRAVRESIPAELRGAAPQS
jgi:glyoxylase-like metal-dependent hydrolase (beta-lactamase superfamily II)